MILRHNVQYRGSLLGLPIMVVECSKRDQLERPKQPNRLKIRLFQGANVDEVD